MFVLVRMQNQKTENESGVYGVSARGSMSKIPNGTYSFTIAFPCGPENAEKLTDSALRELQKIIDKGPQDADLKKFKEAEILDYKKEIKENIYLMGNFNRSYTNGTNPEDILQFEAKVNAVTAKDIQDVAKKYLTKDKVVGMLMPEKI